MCRLNPLCASCAGIAKLQEVEHRLNVPIESIVALAGEGEVARIRACDRLAWCSDRARQRGDAVLRRVLTVVALVVERRGVALIIRRDDAPAEHGVSPVAMIDLASPYRTA